MEFSSCRLNVLLAVLCDARKKYQICMPGELLPLTPLLEIPVFYKMIMTQATAPLVVLFRAKLISLLMRTAHTESSVDKNHEKLLKKSGESFQSNPEQNKENITRRQDNGFDFMKYFLGNRQQQVQQNQQQANAEQQQLRQAQQPHTIQQQHQLQQQQLAQQQMQQQQQLQQLQKQQLLAAQMQQLQQQQAPRSNEVYQDNTAQQQQQQPVALNRDGGYGQVGLGGNYPGGGYEQPGKQIGISIGGGGRPGVIPVGNILTLLPRIMNILSAGGKVMFGVELGNNFYFGPVGAKPLYG